MFLVLGGKRQEPKVKLKADKKRLWGLTARGRGQMEGKGTGHPMKDREGKKGTN